MSTAQLEMFTTGATRYAVRPAETVTRRQEVHANSREAYHSEPQRISIRAAQILRHFSTIYAPQTDRQVMNALGFSDMNSVRPRITELIKAGLLVEAGDTIDYVTGKRVRLVRAL
jgi:glutamate-1-semialdehyde aminotransferase